MPKAKTTTPQTTDLNLPAIIARCVEPGFTTAHRRNGSRSDGRQNQKTVTGTCCGFDAASGYRRCAGTTGSSIGTHTGTRSADGIQAG